MVNSIDKNFIIAINILNKLNIKYFVVCGTLLGIVRDKNLIASDNDIDIAILKKDLKDKNLIINEFKKKKFLKIKKFYKNEKLISFKKKGGRTVDINIYENYNKNYYICKNYFIKNFFAKITYILSLGKSYRGNYKSFFHLFTFMKKIFVLIKKILIEKNIMYSEGGYNVPKFFFKKRLKFSFKNIYFYSPFLYQRYLSYMYGNWKIKDKKYNWTKSKNFKIL